MMARVGEDELRGSSFGLPNGLDVLKTCHFCGKP
jgi:hypothetical protein